MLCVFIYWCLCFPEVFTTEPRIYLDVTLDLDLLSLSQPYPNTHTHTHTLADLQMVSEE